MLEPAKRKRHGRRFHSEYRRVSNQIAGGGILSFDVAMTKGAVIENVAEIAELLLRARLYFDRGFGFARHVRTNVEIEGWCLHARLLFTPSSRVLAGLKTIDAEVTWQNCMEKAYRVVGVRDLMADSFSTPRWGRSADLLARFSLFVISPASCLRS